MNERDNGLVASGVNAHARDGNPGFAGSRMAYRPMRMSIPGAPDSLGMVFEADDETGSAAAAAAKAEADAAAAAKAKADKDAADALAAEEAKKKSGLSDKEAELLREVMEKKTKLKELEKQLADANKRFEGIDPDEVKKLLAEKKTLEEAELEKKGEWDRLKARMAEENGKAVDGFKKQLQDLGSVNQTLAKTIEDLTVGQAFANSSFITDETILTPSKARVIYGSFFEIEEGKVVAYDKPRGATSRTKFVDAAGEAVSFEDAIKKIIDLDTDKDRLLRAKSKPGAESKSDPVKKKPEETELKGVSRIRAALAKK